MNFLANKPMIEAPRTINQPMKCNACNKSANDKATHAIN